MANLRFPRYLFYPAAALNHRSLLPKQPGVYYAVSWFKPWQPLYIGMSGSLHKRWNSHSHPHHKLWKLSKYPWVKLHYKQTSTRAKAAELESYEIRWYNPPLNGRDESPEQYGWRYAVYKLKRESIGWCFAGVLVLGLAVFLMGV
jgi:excinuclease UvrABC nuclease subunit